MKRKVSDSYTTQVQIVSQAYLNGFNRLFGGKLMEWIDVVAAVVARRHSGRNVTTVMVDALQFKAPAYANNLIVLKGKITYVGRTSMEVCVKSYAEDSDGTKRLINTAYLVMVAMDEHERPVEVPRLILETEEDKADWLAGEKRYKLRSTRRHENF